MIVYTTVRYTCNACGIDDVKVLVRARREDEDIKEWVENVMSWAIIDHHKIFSPKCRARTMANVKIPVGGKNKDLIGGPQ